MDEYKCSNCGNEDPAKTIHFDGPAGIEFLVCGKCGGYCDFTTVYPPSDWSKAVAGVKKDV